MSRDIFHLTRLLRAPSNLALNPAREGAATASLGNLCQPVLVGEVLQPSDHLRGPPLDPLQHIHVLLVLGAPELDAGLQVGSDESGVKGQNPLPIY